MFFYSWLLHICIPVNAKFIILIVKSSIQRFLFKLCLDWYFLDTTLDYRNLIISNILKHQCDFVDKLHIPTLQRASLFTKIQTTSGLSGMLQQITLLAVKGLHPLLEAGVSL